MNDEKLKLIFLIIGGVLGIIAFLWNLVGYIWTYVLSHLQIDISNEKIVIKDKELLKVTTIVENKGSIAKKIDFAFLLINPDGESFNNSLVQVTNQQETVTTSELLRVCVEKGKQLTGLIINNSFAIYNLPFYYDEQFQIGNEKIKYSCMIDLSGLQKNKAYNIRFVTISMHLFKTYLRHRSTADLFYI